MKPTTLVIVVAAAVAIAASGGVAAADAGTAQDDLVTVQVQVTTADGDPVSGAGATVEWEGADPRQHTTLSDGTFRTDVPADAEWTLTLDHDDYVRNFAYEQDGADQDEVVDVTMYPSVSPTVDVVDGSGEAVEGARVRLQKDGQSRSAASGDTNSGGTFSAGEIEAGDYELRVSEPGYYEHREDVTIEGGFHKDVTIEEGDVNVDLLVQDPTPDGPGTLDASVTFARNGQEVKSVRTNDAGERTVALAVNTRYDVTAEREGYTRVRDAIRTREDPHEYVINMTREPGITLEAANSRVVVGERLPVEVVDEYDRPVEGATVYVDGEARGETDAEGEARVEISEQGQATVHAEFEDHSSEETTVEGITQSEADGSPASELPDDVTPGFGPVAALVALLGAAALARQS